MTHSDKAYELVEQSAASCEIETYAPDDIEDAMGVVDELTLMCWDRAENGLQEEFWGEDDDGNEWRVHVILPPSRD